MSDIDAVHCRVEMGEVWVGRQEGGALMAQAACTGKGTD